MILNCNSCEKKFVVPDNVIKSEGRVVQCGSCGNKWKQFPLINQRINLIETKKFKNRTSPQVKKTKIKRVKKTRDIDLYSPEYLEKKHGISLDKAETNKKTISNNIVSFGFYNYLLLLVVIFITLAKSLHFFQDFIVQKIPYTKFYLDYFFESMRNIFEIWNNLISGL
jgi:predicted Zn finger-like uncharacterized protein